MRYILFHHQTTTLGIHHRCVISCVISSFITKPQLDFGSQLTLQVALYPLSSPNHNHLLEIQVASKLRYILFHHQTTTQLHLFRERKRCVISSFITKPQHWLRCNQAWRSCVISSFITKPQLPNDSLDDYHSCVISSFITKPQLIFVPLRIALSCVISSFITKPQR